MVIVDCPGHASLIKTIIGGLFCFFVLNFTSKGVYHNKFQSLFLLRCPNYRFDVISN